MSKIRKAADGQPCTIRLPFVCRSDGTNTMLCHIRTKWNAGVGMKPDDMHGFFGCHECHEVYDGRNMGARGAFTYSELQAYAMEAMMRTHRVLRDLEIIEVKR